MVKGLMGRLAAGAAVAAMLAPTLACAAQLDPAQGDGGVPAFYQWTEAVPATPGAMLRTEPLPAELVLANAARGVRILYASTNGIDGKTPTPVSGALFLPKGAPPAGGWPLMAWSHGTVGVADVCAPSFAGRSQRDINYLNHWLAQGYAVVASDYQGLGTPGGHPYMASRPAAYSVLDSVRAVQHGDFGLSKEVVIVGQSQGGGAAFATAGYASTYAPELDVRGTVATGTPWVTPRIFQAVTAAGRDKPQATFGYVLLMLYLIRQTDPSFQFADYVSDKAMPAVKLGATGCLQGVEEAVVDDGLTYENSFIKDPTEKLNAVFGLMGYATLAPAAPVFMGTGALDKDVPPPMQQALIRSACAAGARIEAHEYEGLDHSGAVNGSLGDSTPFVKKAFAGETIGGNCADNWATQPAQ
ncbi:lipase family protein [Phenylobacterium sp.]|uniref:lipase family protein n=1 Tax=Phenylobacterium sp. TaxID=1871053 RepID=UPI0035B090DE